MTFKVAKKQIDQEEDHYSALSEAELQDLTDLHYERIRPRKLDQLNHVAVIFNPTSGARRDIRQVIEQRLNDTGTRVTFFSTNGYMHAWRLAQVEIDIADFDVLVAAGGDGTLHEVVNGLLNRIDGKRIPVAFIPNGSGNDTCYDLGLKSVEQAIDCIIKRETIKLDVNRVILDAESIEDIPETERQ